VFLKNKELVQVKLVFWLN